mgnify:CR=1 FL=1
MAGKPDFCNQSEFRYQVANADQLSKWEEIKCNLGRAGVGFDCNYIKPYSVIKLLKGARLFSYPDYSSQWFRIMKNELND